MPVCKPHKGLPSRMIVILSIWPRFISPYTPSNVVFAGRYRISFQGSSRCRYVSKTNLMCIDSRIQTSGGTRWSFKRACCGCQPFSFALIFCGVGSASASSMSLSKTKKQLTALLTLSSMGIVRCSDSSAAAILLACARSLVCDLMSARVRVLHYKAHSCQCRW